MKPPSRHDDLPTANQVLAREERIRANSKIYSHISATCLAILFVFVLSQFSLDSLKGLLVDGMFRLQWWNTSDSDIALVAYDDNSSMRYNRSSRIPVEELTALFKRLELDRPRAVAIISTISTENYTEAELAVLGKLFARVPNTFVGYVDDESLGKSVPVALNMVGSYLPGFVSRDAFSYGADSVTRRAMVSIEGFETVYSRLACLYRGLDETECQQNPRYEKIGDSLQAYINWQGPTGSYPSIPSWQVAEGKVPRGTFRDKIVLIGTRLSTRKARDYIFTPFSRKPYHTSQLEGAAHSLVSLIRDDTLTKTPAWLNLLVSLLVGILTVNMVLFLPPGRGIIFVVAEIALLVGAAWFSLHWMNSWINLAHPLLIACVGYYLVIPYRLVDEYRKRWHYQEKSELMAQLELLKSNFLSLVSHDLKTPVARIQGNAELLIAGASSKLTDKQQKSLQAIVHTTEDLGQYVESVLDLTRIESSGMPLDITTRDINATIMEVVSSKSHFASDKSISLQTRLEPMFSFKYDGKLMRRVISNLVENAIKYSPENSEITVSSEESGEWVKVSISDSGMGISSEDQEKIFLKFFRCDTSNTQQEKGTGLGLYLVKYFVELHKGFVELKSELGKGSTFSVYLPV